MYAKYMSYLKESPSLRGWGKTLTNYGHVEPLFKAKLPTQRTTSQPHCHVHQRQGP